jgi:YidC/Oxa1 family membrane protein insertase
VDLWIKDLSAPDPYFVLPVIYAITAYLQVKLSPTPISDPVQAKVMQIMPIAFSVMFIFFPSGSCSTGSSTTRCRSSSSGT